MNRLSDPEITSRRGREIFEFIKENPKATIYRITKETGCDKKTARKYKKLHDERCTTEPDGGGDESPSGSDPGEGHEFYPPPKKQAKKRKPTSQSGEQDDADDDPDPGAGRRNPRIQVRRW